MDKYISDIIKPEDIKVKTSICYVDDIREDTVCVLHIPSDIQTCETSEIGQVDAYNRCIHKLEFRIKFGKFKNFYDHNPDIFLENFLGLKLKAYQKALIRMMCRKN